MSWKKRIAIGIIVISSLLGIFKDEIPADVYTRLTNVVNVVQTVNQAIDE